MQQKRPTTPDPNDAELTTIERLLSSSALNPPAVGPTGKQPPLIGQTASLLRSRSRKNEHGILLPREPGGLDVKVTEGTLERALQVMSRILAVLERLGHRVEVSEKGRTVAVINGECVPFGIEELVRRVVTQKPRMPNPTDRWDYDQVVTFEPSGKLALVIHVSMWGELEHRTKWSDAKVQRVENLLADFVAGLLRTAVLQRRQEEARNRREVERQRREREANTSASRNSGRREENRAAQPMGR
jgi:hypothetical protein